MLYRNINAFLTPYQSYSYLGNNSLNSPDEISVLHSAPPGHLFINP
jgi:hypothetical protein